MIMIAAGGMTYPLCSLHQQISYAFLCGWPRPIPLGVTAIILGIGFASWIARNPIGKPETLSDQAKSPGRDLDKLFGNQGKLWVWETPLRQQGLENRRSGWPPLIDNTGVPKSCSLPQGATAAILT
jgi:hypothetical protein